LSKQKVKNYDFNPCIVNKIYNMYLTDLFFTQFNWVSWPSMKKFKGLSTSILVSLVFTFGQIDIPFLLPESWWNGQSHDITFIWIYVLWLADLAKWINYISQWRKLNSINYRALWICLKYFCNKINKTEFNAKFKRAKPTQSMKFTNAKMAINLILLREKSTRLGIKLQSQLYINDRCPGRGITID